MKKILLLSSLFVPGLIDAVPIAGVDFSDESGASTDVPEDLDTNDSVTVSAGWIFPGTTGRIIQGDANANAGRASAPVVKFDGPADDGTPPAVGDPAPTDGIHQFSIEVGSDRLKLTKVSFDFGKATGSANIRWIAFKTSLDDKIIYSALGPARPNFTSVELPLVGAQYEGLQEQTVDFIWYCGGQGSGDIDIDSILIEGLMTTDEDNDGLPDAFERTIIEADPNDAFLTIGDVFPGDDFDNDGSDNLEEFTRGTLPTNPDSDNDGLLDGVESGDGTFDSLATDTGTSPLDSDTDDDGLLDGVESNDGSFNDITETGSNPLLSDTDSDNFRDGAEVMMHGTDPADAGSFPATQTTVLFLGANGTGTAGADEVAVAFLEDKFGLDKVTVGAASAAVTGDELDYDLLVLSSTPGSGDIRNKFLNSVVPIINWEEAVSDNGEGEFGASSEIMTKSNTTTEILLGDHPISSGLPETITLFEGAIGQTNSTSMVFGELVAVGTAVQGTGNGGLNNGGDVTGNAMIIAIEAGDAVDPLTGTEGGVAPARRVMMPWTDEALANLSPDGFALFSNVIDWVIGKLGNPVPLQILSIGIDDTEPGSRIATLVFTSREGQEYIILTSGDLMDFSFGNEAEVTSVIGAEGTTTIELNFNAFGIPSSDARRFFSVREGGGE